MAKPEPCPDCPTCQATARVEAALKDSNFEDAMVALCRVMAIKMAPEVQQFGKVALDMAEGVLIKQLREDVMFELDNSEAPSSPVRH